MGVQGKIVRADNLKSDHTVAVTFGFGCPGVIDTGFPAVALVRAGSRRDFRRMWVMGDTTADAEVGGGGALGVNPLHVCVVCVCVRERESEFPCKCVCVCV